MKRLCTYEGDIGVRMNVWRFLTSFYSLDREALVEIVPANTEMRPTDAFLWIDQICVNQDDLLERNAQAMQMTQIFSKASSVICWPSNSNWEMQVFGAVVSKYSNDLKRPATFRNHVFFNDFIRRKRGLERKWLCERVHTQAERALAFAGYWNRVWVQQELILAQRIVIMCGPYCLNLLDSIDEPWHRETWWCIPTLLELRDVGPRLGLEVYRPPGESSSCR